MFRKLIIAGAIVAVSGGLALAQSAPSPKNSTNTGANTSTNAPTDPSAADQNGNVKGKAGGKVNLQGAANGSTGKDSAMKGSRTTTGSGMGAAHSKSETMKKNASPASAAEGAGKEK